MTLHTLSPDDVAPLLEGLAIVGTGGGGSPSWGQAILEHDFAMGRIPSITPLDEIDDDATVVADSFIWLETTALSGTPTTVHCTWRFDWDA